MGNLTFTEDGWEDYLYWQTQDKKTLKKINMLLKGIQREPFAGEGHRNHCVMRKEIGADVSMRKTGLSTEWKVKQS